MTSKPQGHPARTNRDELHTEIERLARRTVELVPKIIRDKRFSPHEITYAKASAVGILHLLSILEKRPSPYEIHAWKPTK